MPFIQQMCVALQQSMETELQERVDKVLKKQLSAAEYSKEATHRRAPGASYASPPLPDRACGGPFNSLLGGGTPTSRDVGPGGRWLGRRCTPPFEETLQEENSSDEDDVVEQEAGGRSESEESVPQKVTFAPSAARSTGGSSKGTSPNLQGPEPPVDVGSAWPLDSAASGPMYLARPQTGGRLTPVASPLVPSTQPPWQLSEVFNGPGGGEQQMTIVMEGDAATDGADEKSVMVCRHWKSKGWCRMEDKCKFLHPDHKRGSGARKGASSGGGAAIRDASPAHSEEDIGDAEVDSGAAGKTGSTKSRRSRTSRRKAAAAAADGTPPARENGSGSGATTAAPAAPGLVRGVQAPGGARQAAGQGLKLTSAPAATT